MGALQKAARRAAFVVPAPMCAPEVAGYAHDMIETDAERALQADLAGLGADRLADADFCGQLYRALAGRRWWRADAADQPFTLSWKRAEELVNALRGTVGAEPLALAQTGGESWVSTSAAEELGQYGWRSEDAQTDRFDPHHRQSDVDEPRTPPAEKVDPGNPRSPAA